MKHPYFLNYEIDLLTMPNLLTRKLEECNIPKRKKGTRVENFEKLFQIPFISNSSY